MSYRGNTRNKENRLYKTLTRLFSGPLTQYKKQFYRREKRDQYNKKYDFNSASGLPFKKSNNDMFMHLSARFISEQQRAERYADYDLMVYDPILNSALDIFADEITTTTMFKDLLDIKCKNVNIKAILHNLYYDILNIPTNLFYWVRTTCKRGDFFLYLDIDEKLGVQNVISLPAREIERMEGEDITNPNYIQFQWNAGGMTFERWQIAHFRIQGEDKYAPYGTSVLDSARRIFRQYTLIKDAMMAYRVVRSAERRVYYLDVGNIPPSDVEQYVLRFQKELKKNQVINPNDGRVDIRYNAQSIEDDLVVPVRGQTQTRIETLPGGQYTGDVDDVKFLQNEMLAALKIPPSYILPSDDGNGDEKTTLSQKDVRFANTIMRIQRNILEELRHIGFVHLKTQGFSGDDLIDWDLALANPSKISVLQHLEEWRTKLDTAGAATESFFSKRYAWVNFFGLSEEDFIRNQREIYNDKKFELQQEKQAQEVEEGAFGPEAGALGGGGGDIPGPGGEELVDIEPPPEDEAGGDETLQAQPEEPAKRDDDVARVKVKKNVMGKDAHVTPGSKGKEYTPKQHDSRKSSGPRRRHTDSLWSKESTKNTNRARPHRDLFSLGMGISEHDEKHEEEQRVINENLHKISKEIDEE